MRVFESSEARRAAVLRVGALLAGVLLLVWLVTRYAPFLMDPVWVRTTIREAGPLGPVVFVGIQALQVVFAPIPGQTLAVAGGFLFGPVGAVYSVAGVALGSAVVLVLSRRYGRPFVERVVAESLLERFDTFVEEYGVVGLAVVFALPTFPDDAICALAGLTEVRLRTILAVLVVARTPTFVLATLVGDGLAEAQFRLVAGIVVVAGLVVLATYLGRERLLAALPTDHGSEPTSK